MKVVITIISVLMILFGSVFFLQGINVLGGSRMTGQPQWVFNGAAIAIIGLAVLIYTYWRRGARPKQ